ncbi:MAG: PAS domain S-box protein [Chloroflexaceae bacterium]|nr:PAS domain S-box protein [Chloroflexaceae bacterium]
MDTMTIPSHQTLVETFADYMQQQRTSMVDSIVHDYVYKVGVYHRFPPEAIRASVDQVIEALLQSLIAHDTNHYPIGIEPLLLDILQDQRVPLADVLTALNLVRRHLLRSALPAISDRLPGAVEGLLLLEQGCDALTVVTGTLYEQWRSQQQHRVVETALQYEQRQAFYYMVEHIADAIGTIDLDWKITYANRACRDIMGYGDSLIGMHILDMFSEDRAYVMECIQNTIDNNSWCGILAFRRCNGSTFQGELSAVTLCDLSGAICGVAGVFRDISGEQQRDEALSTSQQRLAKLQERYDLAVNMGRVVIWDIDVATGSVYVSPGITHMLGYAPEITPQDVNEWQNLVYEPDLEAIQAVIKHQIAAGCNTYDTEVRLYHAGSSLRWFALHGQIALDATGQPYRHYGTCIDITDRKQAEEALRERENLLQSILKHSPAVIYVKDLEGRFLLLNDAIEQVVGADWRAKMLHQRDVDIFPPELAQAWQANEQRVIASQRAYTFEEPAILVDEQPADFLSIKFPIFNEQGEISAIGGISTNITERKRANAEIRRLNAELEQRIKARTAELAASQERYVLAVKAGRVGIWDLDLTTNEIYLSPELKEMLGYADHEIGTSMEEWATFLLEDDRARVLAAFEGHLTGTLPAYDIEHRLWHKDGQARWFHTHAQVIPNDTGQPVRMIGTKTDITQQKKLFQQIEEHEQWLKLITNSVPVLISYVDSDLTYRFGNRYYQEWFGIAPEQMIGRSVRDVVGEANYLFALDKLQRVLSGEEVTYTWEMQLPNGSIRYLRSDYIPHIDAQGRVLGCFTLGTDLTEQRTEQKELAYLNVRLRGQRKLDRAILEAHSSDDIAMAALLSLQSLISYQTAHLVLMARETKHVLVSQFYNNQHQIDLVLIPSFSRNEFEPDTCCLHMQEHFPEQDICCPWHDDWPTRKVTHELYRATFQVGDTVIGCFMLQPIRDQCFSDEELEIIDDIVDRLSIALWQSYLFEQARQNREQLQHLSHRLVDVQESERRWIAGELHDEIGQQLTGLRLGLQLLPRLPNDAQKHKIAEMSQHIFDLMEQVRSLSLKLRPPMLDDLGLLPTLFWHFERYQDQTEVQVDFKHHDLEHRSLPDRVVTVAYRIIQEALTNVARHAQVSEVMVRLWVENDQLCIKIEDEGQGFQIEIVKQQASSSGLLGMYERAKCLNGTLNIESWPGKGTCLSVELPLLP